jgi:hypothetical protein
MNAYILVEGRCTESIVIPKWLEIIAPNTTRINDPWEVNDNNYYSFDGGGIPQIYKHIVNAVIDINTINAIEGKHYDYLMVLMDVEEESREYIEQQIQNALAASKVRLNNTELLLFEQQVCIESWFLGNRAIFKDNPQDIRLRNYIDFYNVKTDNPELMGNIDIGEFATKAQFHHSYLTNIFRERHMKYHKNNPGVVCEQTYLSKLIDRNRAVFGNPRRRQGFSTARPLRA